MPVLSTRVTESSAALGARFNHSRAVSPCKGPNRNTRVLSRATTKSTQALHSPQTPSKKITGSLSIAGGPVTSLDAPSSAATGAGGDTAGSVDILITVAGGVENGKGGPAWHRREECWSEAPA